MIANIHWFNVRILAVIKCIRKMISNIRIIVSFSYIIVSFVKNNINKVVHMIVIMNYKEQLINKQIK